MFAKSLTFVTLLVLISLLQVDGGHRSERGLYINPDVPLSLFMQMILPMSLLLPTLADTEGGGEDEDSYSRSFKDKSQQNGLTDHQYPEDFTWEPSYEEELGKLKVYFTYLKVLSVQCQERLLCEMASNPDAFSPLSELILREIRPTHGPVKLSQDSLFWRFLAASATGFAYSEKECVEYYGTCPSSASQMINMSKLKMWKFLSSQINLQLRI